MKCPIDDNELMMTDRQGIEIDYCPKCRGIWFDRGELDKIVERSAAPLGDARSAVNPETPRYQEPQKRHSSNDNYYDDRQYGKKRKREGFLGDLFDF